MKRAFSAVGFALLAGSVWAGSPGWRSCRAEGAPDKVVDWTTALPEKAQGVFVNEDGDVFCTGRGYKGDIVPSRKPRPGEAFTWRFRFGDARAYWPSMGITWGAAYEMGLSCNPERLGWTCNKLAADGKKTRMGFGSYTTKAQIPRLFHWDADASAALDRLLNRPPSQDFTRDTYLLTLEFGERSVTVKQNGVISGTFKVDETFYAETPVLHLAPYVHFRGLTARALARGFRLYEPVEIANRLNVAGQDGDSLLRAAPQLAPQPNEWIEAYGVPFRMPKVGRAGSDNIDLGESWMFHNRIQQYEWNEGRRFPEASQAFPGRFTFRVPYDQYDRLYVLAAADSTRPDAIDTFTAQIYAPKCGFPKNYRSEPVAAFSVKGRRSLEVRTSSGATNYLHLVEIPLDFTKAIEFDFHDSLEIELTKEVYPWLTFPDPGYGSFHPGGKPTRVHVYAMTLRRNDLPVSLRPRQKANLFVEGEAVEYDFTLANRAKKGDKLVNARFSAKSLDGLDATNIVLKAMRIPAGGAVTNLFAFTPRRFGHYDAELVWTIAGRPVVTNRYRKTFAYIRKREYGDRDMNTPGHMFGFWPWRGGHNTPSSPDQLEIAGRMGMESFGAAPQNHGGFSEEERKVMEKYHQKSFFMRMFGYNEFGNKLDKERGVRYMTNTNAYEGVVNGTLMQKRSSICNPQLVCAFPEGGGANTHGVPGIFYGESWQCDAKMYAYWSHNYVKYVEATLAYLKGDARDVRFLVPWGDPVTIVPYLLDEGQPILRKYLKGLAFDQPTFGRLPEAQVSQNSALHRMCLVDEVWQQMRPGEKPFHVSIEGPFIAPAREMFFRDEVKRAAYGVRSILILSAYGIEKQFSCVDLADCADYWGEQQYGGGGVFGRQSELNPHVLCAAVATAIRHLRDMVFDGWDPMPTHNVYCLRYRDAKTGERMRVLWTLVGKREATVTGDGLRVYDSMDNILPPARTLTLSPLPVWVRGCGDDFAVALGDADNSDSTFKYEHVKLGAAKDILDDSPGFFRSAREDTDYTQSFAVMVRRFPAKMESRKTDEGLEVAMDPVQPVDRRVMPYYTTFFCDEELPGRPAYIDMEVKACADWGRIVYELVDAKGEKFLSVGQKDEWNVDDQGAYSFFLHDGWRLLRFPLPGNRPYDCQRWLGSTWWGMYGGDGIVDYPLTLKKVYVERRPKAIYVNSLEPVPNYGPVTLGDIHLEYFDAADRTGASIADTRLRMSVDAAEMSDVRAALEKKGTLPPTEMISVVHPLIQDTDGRKGLFNFREVEGAVAYDIYLSLDPLGRGALKVKTVKKSGERVDGLKANVKTYAMLVYRLKNGRVSKPSPIFEYKLDDAFAQK